jgi:hypothetical protein
MHKKHRSSLFVSMRPPWIAHYRGWPATEANANSPEKFDGSLVWNIGVAMSAGIH